MFWSKKSELEVKGIILDVNEVERTFTARS